MTKFTKERLEEIAELARKATYKPCAMHMTNLLVVCDSEVIEEMARRLLAAEADEPIYQVQYGQHWRDVSAISYEDHAKHGAPVRTLYAAPPVAQPVHVPDDYFASLVDSARVRADKAMRKFPQPNYVLNKVAEESGEVIKAVIHYTEGREEWVNVEGEIIDNLAMLIRLVQEGDQVIGFKPPDACRAASTVAQPVQVPDELVELLISAIEKEQERLFGEDYLMDSKDCVDVIREESQRVNSSRAAMLQGAEHVSNRDELTDGWVACSERMPEVGVKVLCFPVNDEPIHATYNGQVWLQDISWSTSDEPIDNVISCNVFHWMPLPAAPQQEGENV